MAWTDFYGFKTGFTGQTHERGMPGDAPGTSHQHEAGTAFDANALRRARKGMFTGASIKDYLQSSGSWAATDQAIRDEVFQDIGSQRGMQIAYDKIQDIGSPDLSGYARTSDIPDVSNLATKDSLGGYAKTSDLLNYAKDTDLTNLETDVTNLTGAGQALSGRLGIVESTQAKQKTDIGKAMTEALKVRTTSAQPVQNQATPIGIQAAQSPSAQAGMISAGLAGLSRSNKKFKNKTLNI